MRATTIVAGALVAFMGLAGPVPVDAQQRGQQKATQQQAMRQQQQQMAQMQEMMQRMDRLQERVHKLDQKLARQMDQIRDRDQLRDQDRLRLQQHEHLREMCQSTGDMIRNMARNTERLRTMAGDPAVQEDPELRRQMEQLRQRFMKMTEETEKGLEDMEKLQDQLRDRIRDQDRMADQ